MRMRVGTLVTLLGLVLGARPWPAAAADDPPPRGPVNVVVVAAQPLQLPKEEYERLRKEAQAAKAVFDQEMKDLMGASGTNFDRMFLQMMIRHHQGAISMANTEQQQGQDPQAKQLAAKIASDQAAEIREMQDQLTRL